MVRLVNSVEVVANTAAGVPMVEIRVIATWGGYSGQDCGCLTTQLYVGVNADGDDIHAFALPELLEPTVDSITTEAQRPVVYITYGDVGARSQIRAEVLDSQLNVTPARKR